ncbi:baculoviral IAP repeat-containing protein 2 isoform X2 [Narcine bancroftii]|uniref:baculoviral IAP repeat-containing protein 2 isoform X2 n=1 Tax=Narcine bancroftii TaxID=1343680 RepID=UPI003831DD5D
MPLFCKIFFMNILQNQNFGNLRISGDQELQYDLSSELYRISTFAKFPASVLLSERSLARAGFYYTNIGDKVQCFSCGVIVENWQPGDNAVERHKKSNPSCSFINHLRPGIDCSSSRSQFSLASASFFQSAFSENGAPSDLYPSNLHEPMASRSMEDLPYHLRYPHYSAAMCCEETRLQTFQNWPSYSSLMPTDLAKAGFYYTGEDDKVACFICGGRLSNWEPGDRATTEHRRHFPSCPFILGNEVGNIPMNNSESQRQNQHTAMHPRHPEMQSYDIRLQTFLRWPVRNFIQPEQLSRAGFYYVGHNDDVKCFYCDGGLRSWEAGDDPWVEHAKWFPRCEYLLQEKGQTFVNQIQSRFPNLLDLQLHSSSDDILEETQTSVNFEPGENGSEDAVMMNTPVVKGAMEMGFGRKLVKQTVQRKIVTSGENYKSVIELVTDLLNAEDEERQEDKERKLEEMAEVHKSLSCSASDTLGLSMEEQLRRLQEERTCKVCMDKEVSVVFITCGHLVVCTDCAPSLRKCPICRDTIKGTVRTFLS